ncbi:ABC transporter ATP-binding protein [Paramicrobacterium agarici]|nr:ABC transporter ATP-binding protein [Microbacterium agarici]
MKISTSQMGLAARVVGVSKGYGRGQSLVRALDGVTVGLRTAEFTAIMGPSGSGKSTLMHVMAGLDSVDSGEVWIGDDDITSLGDSALTVLRRRRIGFVFQAFNLVPTLDAEANILLPFDLDGRTPTSEEQNHFLTLVDRLGLNDRLRHRPSELSGGQQQRVAIARALVTRPDIVFADEPTGNLDSRSGREVLSILSDASRNFAQTIAMVTHDAAAASMASRVIVLGDGRVVGDLGPSSAEQIASTTLRLEQSR